jgi:hypothetical protein
MKEQRGAPKVFTMASRGSSSGAGASSRKQYDRLRDERRRRVEARLGKRLGGLACLLSGEPQSTQAWLKGSEGEQRLAAFLERRLPASAVVLHDLLVPGTRANIDHVVVAASGVWVIDAKRYSGKLERRRAGLLSNNGDAIIVAGRNRTNVVDGLPRQVDAVRKAVGAAVAVTPVVCFLDSEWGLRAKAFELNGVLVTRRRDLLRRISAPGELTPEAVVAVSRQIALSLASAAR